MWYSSWVNRGAPGSLPIFASNSCLFRSDLCDLKGRHTMFRKSVMLATLFTLLSTTSTLAQDDKLGLIIPNLYGPEGLFVESDAPLAGGGDHSAHFNSSFQSEFTQFNIALARELSALP